MAVQETESLQTCTNDWSHSMDAPTLAMADPVHSAVLSTHARSIPRVLLAAASLPAPSAFSSPFPNPPEARDWKSLLDWGESTQLQR